MEQLTPIEINPNTFLRQHCTLPGLPPVVNRIQEMILTDNVDIGGVVKLISSDPSLVAQTLKMVNSSYFGLPREVSGMRYAIAFLGLNEVYRMVLSLSVINTIAVKEKDELEKFWFHSFYAAVSTKHLAKKFEPHLSFDELWAAAILHDIGKLVYLKFFPDHYKALMKFCNEEGCLFSEAEKHFSLPASSYLGALLCDHWRLPSKVKDACENHSFSDLQNLDNESPTRAFKYMICLGNLMTVLSADQLAEEKKSAITEAIKKSLKCSETEFLALVADIYDLKIEVERFMVQF